MPSPFDFFLEVREMREELNIRLSLLEEKLDMLLFLSSTEDLGRNGILECRFERNGVDWYGDGK